MTQVEGGGGGSGGGGSGCSDEFVNLTSSHTEGSGEGSENTLTLVFTVTA